MMGAAIVGEIPISVLPDAVGLAIAALELALEEHTDYQEAQVTFSLRTEKNPTVHFICDADA